MSSYKIQIRGHVQGVGFRPFIYKIAKQLSLLGCVYNDHEGVWILCECAENELNFFIAKIHEEKPMASTIEEISILKNLPQNFTEFLIIESQGIESQVPTAPVLPDLVVCKDCLKELMDVSDRRYQYPFINCTQCGPRFSIIQSLPYDRSRTTMAEFLMCHECSLEYKDPSSRRFHAEPIACPACGPELQLCNSEGRNLLQPAFSQHTIIDDAVLALHEGKIIALKGVGGFQLIVRAKDDQAVALLRERKKRPTKPFAVMVKDITMAEMYVALSAEDKKQLTSLEAPIILLADQKRLAHNVNPDNPYLGLMVATSPLHFLILEKMNEPIVATSANISNEPICIDNDEAVKRLGHIADFFLMNNRRIVRPVDDSVIQMVEGQSMILRRSRGYAPKTFLLKSKHSNLAEVHSEKIFALGPHLKNTFSFKDGPRVFLSQHIGDLESSCTQQVWLKEIAAVQKFYHLKPEKLLHDLHPDYSSTRMAHEYFSELEKKGIQHHEAHAWAGIFEYDLDQSDLAIAIWDGAGLGHDKTIWGGEFFIHKAQSKKLQRVATLESFSLLGGEKAFLEPWRVLLSLLFEYYPFDQVKDLTHLMKIPVDEFQFSVLHQMWLKKMNSPTTSSMGRIFDAFSCLLGFSMNNHFEAEAAMKMQFAAEKASMNYSQIRDMVRPIWKNFKEKHSSSIDIEEKLSFQQLLTFFIQRIQESDGHLSLEDREQLALQFHYGLVWALVEWVEKMGVKKLLVGGGVFQNRLLLKGLIELCREKEIAFYFPREIPINDGGISLGQLIAFHQLGTL